MAADSQPDREEKLSLLDAQIKEAYGRVLYAHKTHEKSADIYLGQHRLLVTAQIVLGSITSAGIFGGLLGTDNRWAQILSLITSTILLCLTTFTKANDLGQKVQSHTETAAKLWSIRESYFSLIVDIKARLMTLDEIRVKRDELQALTAAVYASAPRADDKAYGMAQKAIKTGEVSFTEEELAKLLPKAISAKKTNRGAKRGPVAPGDTAAAETAEDEATGDANPPADEVKS